MEWKKENLSFLRLVNNFYALCCLYITSYLEHLMYSKELCECVSYIIKVCNIKEFNILKFDI